MQKHPTHRLRGGHESEEIDSEGSWAISYGDMITLLMSFFVLYFSMDPQVERSETLANQLVATLLKAPDTEMNIQKSSPLSVGDQQNSEGVSMPIIERWGGKIVREGQAVLIDFPDVSFFDLGKIEPNSKGQEIITEFATLFTPFAGSYKVSVRAFTDTRAVMQKKDRKFQDNLELSALRSLSTLRLLQQSGLPLANMRIEGFGELEVERNPASLDDRALARKVMFLIEPLRGLK